MGVLEELLAKQEQLEAKQAKQEKAIATLRKFIKPTMSQKEAADFCGISESTLVRERDRPGTLIRYDLKGPNGTKPVYQTESLIAYNERHIPVMQAS